MSDDHDSRPERLRLLLISGSLREGSTNTALNTVRALTPPGVEAELYTGMGTLPHFNPDIDREGEPVDPAVADLRERVAQADAILFCTPEYAGALPGALKNLLEWTVGDGSTYRKPVAWINVSGPAAPTGGADAHDSLRKVLEYVHAETIEPACLRLPLARDSIGPDFELCRAADRDRLVEMLTTLIATVSELDSGLSR
ncbi:MAG TPA: NADPH-dependent FMN reductase [Solirubrobacteraceae bacterium]|jgi:NAD(P)H-dependent FMN reductase|nr:NADPH-dependent FMN reductase [Solirubrobacteraceae bacterium]